MLIGVFFMSRMLGTVSMGVRAPIIREGDDLAQIVTSCVADAIKSGEIVVRDRDVVCMTEAIVARAQGNYASWIISLRTSAQSWAARPSA